MLLQKLPSITFTVRRGMSQSFGKRLVGKVAVLTGATEGIGYSMARRMCQEGADVVISSRRAENVSKAVASLHAEGFTSVVGIQCDVGNSQHRKDLIEQSAEKFGGIDIMVSNAGVNPNLGGVLECSEEDWSKLFDINVKSNLVLTQLVVPHMKKRNGGSIIYTGTAGAFHIMNTKLIPGRKMLGGYCVSKTALLGLTKAVAVQLSEFNIRVNSIAPGLIETRFSSVLHGADVVKEHLLKGVPLGRVGNPDECAGVTAFLASDDASYITGENIVVAGGMGSRL